MNTLIEKGLRDIQTKAEEAAKISSSGGKWIPFLRLREGEFAEVRVWTPIDEIIQLRQHKIKMQSPKTGLDIWRRKICTKVPGTDNECAYCNSGSKATRAIFMWAYVFDIYHTSQNKKLNSDPDAEKWESKKVGGETFYVQNFNAPMILMLPPGQKGALRSQLIEYDTEYGSIDDRNYRIKRSGNGLQTTYTVIPKKPTDLEQEVMDKMLDLPDLTEVALGKIMTYDKKDEGSDHPALTGDEAPEKDDLPF